MLRPTTLVAFTATLLTQAVTAQAQPYLQPVTTMQYGTYSMANGFEPAPPIAQRGGPAVLYNNVDNDELWYSPGVQTAPGVIRTWTIDDEIIDQVAFPQAGINGTEQINGITINYCSSIPDPNGTQDVLPLNLYFYKDYEDPNTISNSPTNWPVADCEYGMFLPGGTATGGTLCLSVTVDLGYGVECKVTQELTPGGAEPIGIGWTFGDPRPSPLGDTGPIVDNVIVNPPGYGALDELNLHDRLASTFEFPMFGNGADFYNSHGISIFGQPTDIESYYHVDPITQLPDPQAGDRLILQIDKTVRPAADVTLSVFDSSPFQDIRVAVSRSRADVTRQLTAANPVVDATALVGFSPAQVFGYLPITGGTLGPVTVPQLVSLTTLYVQAFEFSGAFGPSTVTAVSNGLKLTIQ